MKTLTFTKPVFIEPLVLSNAFISGGRRVITAYTRAPGRIGNCHFDDLHVEIKDPLYRRSPAGTEPDIYVQRHIGRNGHPYWEPITAKAHEEIVRQIADALRGDFDLWFIDLMADKALAAGPDCRIEKLRSYAAWLEHQDDFAVEVAKRLADGTVELRKRNATATTVAERDDRNVTMVCQREMRTTYGTKCFDIVADGEVIGWYTTDGEAVSAYSPRI